MKARGIRSRFFRILSDLLEEHRMEVVGMLINEFNERKHWKLVTRAAIEEGREEGRSLGREEGRALGMAQGMAECILKILAECGEIPPELMQRVMGETDLDTLGSWLKFAVKAESIEDFRNRISVSE